MDLPSIDRLEVEVNGGALAVSRFGASSAELPSVLAVHGTTSNSYAWLALARSLAGRATIVAPDLRGRGRSNALGGPYGIVAHVADLVEVLDQLGMDPPIVVVGHSLGAYICARLAADHPERVRAAIMVDGGLTVPGVERVDERAFLDAFLGPALARLKLSFPTAEAYRDWWRAHPACGGSDVDDADLAAYADYDLVGEAPTLRSSVAEQAVRDDGGELLEMGAAAHRLEVPSTLLCAPRGLLDDPNPVQPLPLVQEWAGKAPVQRRAVQVPNANHYTIVLGRAGAAALADVVAAALEP